ncbi:MoaD family protein [Acidianus manzaensis]|uniref:Molybdenum cofactor biosynthesis protein MoaD n=1 Tax=Acidianus manzaensis TaxID=282676 RepID=A0A1W6JXY3_9CREN|nr:MoaD family protein [Acidianus manzaensis]ARM75128.1 molybdenum cofactor biosynthesis protein MoaD [Acidianus manzaensis]
MKMIKIRYFAFLKDITSKSEEEVEINCKDINCLIEFLSKKYGKRMQDALINGINGIKVTILVNGEIKNEINPGDEIAILPPPAGGDVIKGKFNFLDEIKKFRQEAPPEAGSLVVYLGFVKGIVEGHKVYELDYESYEDYTVKRISEIESSVKRKYSDVINIKILHAIDKMKPGDDVILIMCIGKGRKDAIHAIEEAIELVKHTTGIWKLEIRDDGEFWVVAGNTRVKRE